LVRHANFKDFTRHRVMPKLARPLGTFIEGMEQHRWKVFRRGTVYLHVKPDIAHMHSFQLRGTVCQLPDQRFAFWPADRPIGG
jgi:hypothetical protein